MAASDGASSISVTVRVRPFTIREAAQLTKCDDSPLFLGDGSLAAVPTPKLSQKGVRPVIKVVDDRCLVFDPPEDSPVQRFSRSVVPQGRRVKDQTFAFDKVFDDNTSQGDVYEATTKNLLDSVLDGYNATVFAYGATGCGKTHTITGTAQQPGIIFLTMQELFERIADMQGEKNTEISLSYLEIYNETIRDLLVPGGSKAGLMLREDSNQAVSVAGLSSHHPHDVNEVMDMIVRGNEYRTISPTEANATSSRSHAVLQINVTQKDRNADVNEPHTMATLSIIDLAGSERASATKNRGERLIEGANINKSLLALGSCINALCDPRKRNHVPYRNSKLTRLLKFSLGGNCKTVMIVCVSPSSQHFDETQNTLRYANRAKNIQTKVTRNVFNVNRHVKDFLKKIDEQIILINELKQQQKDYENIAFGKYKKQTEKKDSILREGVQRLRSAFEHSVVERQERIASMKKLRQIEKRIGAISSWMESFDGVCEIREQEDPPAALVAMRKQAQGILVELESSRQHYHQRLGKSTWQRTVDAALQTGLKQLQEADAEVDGPECSSLTREADLLKSAAEREFYSTVLESDKVGDISLMQVLLHANFDMAAMINQLLQMDEEEAIAAGKSNLRKMFTACCDASSRLIKLDGSLPLVEVFPPSKSGTPKRRKVADFLGPSPLKPRLVSNVTETNVLASSPARPSPIKMSPRRRVIGSAKRGISFTPKRKSPVKRAVRWRDDTEDGKLADYEKTPQKLESTPDLSSAELPAPSLPTIIDATDALEAESSPLPDPPQISVEVKPKTNRFETGFLSKKSNGSSANRTLPGFSSSPEPSPLQEIEGNRAAGRISGHRASLNPTEVLGTDFGSISGSDSEKSWENDGSNASVIKQVMRKASMSRSASMKDTSRPHRRRSPPTSSAYSPSNENALFTASHARRMVKSDRDNDWRSVLSPHTSSVGKLSNTRRTTIGEYRGLQRSASRPANNRLSTLASSSAHRASMVTGSATKTNWR